MGNILQESEKEISNVPLIPGKSSVVDSVPVIGTEDTRGRERTVNQVSIGSLRKGVKDKQVVKTKDKQ